VEEAKAVVDKQESIMVDGNSILVRYDCVEGKMHMLCPTLNRMDAVTLHIIDSFFKKDVKPKLCVLACVYHRHTES